MYLKNQLQIKHISIRILPYVFVCMYMYMLAKAGQKKIHGERRHFS